MSAFPPNVTFLGGFSMPVHVWHGALDLERKGVTLTVEGDRLLAQPGGLLTPDDFLFIRRHKIELMRLANYITNRTWETQAPAGALEQGTVDEQADTTGTEQGRDPQSGLDGVRRARGDQGTLAG